MKISYTPKKVVTQEICPGDILTKDNECFLPFIKEILKKRFLASDCRHTDIKSFFSTDQGGYNTCDVSVITFLGEQYGRYSFFIKWTETNCAVLIVQD